MSGTPRASVVVAAHNRAERLAMLLAGLRAQTVPSEEFEVIVVDDGSTDDTAVVLREEAERGELRVTALRNDPPRGPAVARNRGWRAAAAPVVVFTDDDCVPVASWLGALLDRIEGREDLIVTGRTLPNPAEVDGLGPYAKTVRIEGPSPHFETCNVAYPRVLLERIGGFDESFPSPAGEDSDLGWRARSEGAAVEFAPEALVHHAVFTRGPLAALRDALLATEGVQAYKRNPELRRHLRHGVFYDRSHALLLEAALGLALARRNPHAALLALPYLRNVRHRARTAGARPGQAPFYLVFDVVQMAAAIRGGIRNRLFIL